MTESELAIGVERLAAKFPPGERPPATIGMRDLIVWLTERGEVATKEVAMAWQGRLIRDVLATVPEGAVPYTHLNYRDE